MFCKYAPTRENKSPHSSLRARFPGGARACPGLDCASCWAASRPLWHERLVQALPLLPRWLSALLISLSGSTGSVYCLRDALQLFLRAGLPTGIYNSRADLGKQNICQGECSEHFNSQPDGLRMERVRVSEWNTALSSALQKPSIPPAGHSVKF